MGVGVGDDLVNVGEDGSEEDESGEDGTGEEDKEGAQRGLATGVKRVQMKGYTPAARRMMRRKDLVH